jgi:hypothetical protein
MLFDLLISEDVPHNPTYVSLDSIFKRSCRIYVVAWISIRLVLRVKLLPYSVAPVKERHQK